MAGFKDYYYNVVRPWEGNFVFSEIPGDAGGATKGGVTLETFRGYRHNINLTADDLKEMTEDECIEICKTLFWDKCLADQINSQSVAEAIVDWCWMSGLGMKKKIQALAGVQPDGIFGPDTINAINNLGDSFFNTIQSARITFINNIVTSNPNLEKFKKGWLNRINSIQ